MPTTSPPSLESTVDVIAPLVTRLANMSFSSDDFPSALKQGRVTALSKKSRLDLSDMANYRTTTNLSEHDVKDTGEAGCSSSRDVDQQLQLISVCLSIQTLD